MILTKTRLTVGDLAMVFELPDGSGESICESTRDAPRSEGKGVAENIPFVYA